jgi:hypothetical protein
MRSEPPWAYRRCTAISFLGSFALNMSAASSIAALLSSRWLGPKNLRSSIEKGLGGALGSQGILPCLVIQNSYTFHRRHI